MKRFKSRYPISEKCPQCGGSDFTIRQPETYVAFVCDRECKACQTRYTPPTPAWAGMLFILIGLLCLAVVGVALVNILIFDSGPFGHFRSGLIGGVCGVIGIACIVHGLRSLKKSRNRPEMEKTDDACQPRS